MRLFMLPIIFGLSLTLWAYPVAAETIAGEKAEHPRIAKAIHALDEAIEYMEHAPHDFGGHKAQAIEDSRKAKEQLIKALEYREHQDNKRKN